MRDAITVRCRDCRKPCNVPRYAYYQDSAYYCWRCADTEWWRVSEGIGERVLRELWRDREPLS